MYSTIPTHETEEQALLAVKRKQPKRAAVVAAFILGVACVSVAPPQSVSSAGDSPDAVALAAHASASLLARAGAADPLCHRTST